jgi:NADPH:quinone reductase-like Zn-dependent oxidoreductase
MGTLNDFDTVMNLVVMGKLKVPVDITFGLKDARAAHIRLESGQQMGKITLKIAD